MAQATYEEALRIVHDLAPEDQRQLRDELDHLLNDREIPRSTGRPYPHRIRPGLDDDLKAIEELAAEIGEAWQGNQSAAEAVSEMRR